MKSSFIATVYNEEDTIDQLIRSLLTQTVKPDEIIIVDGGSTDNTFNRLGKYKSKIKFFVKKGNRAVGRNMAIALAKNDIIACSDGGCILDKHWIDHITRAFSDSSIDMVAGYYKGLPQSIFQKCLIPYVLVMPDRVNPDDFLPATRSIAFRKSVWKEAGGFPEQYSLNEDYVFSRHVKDMGKKIVFVKDAIVYWIPRSSLGQAFSMFFAFAEGDIQALIIRPKAMALFLRYLIGIAVLLASLSNPRVVIYLIVGLGLYLFWAIVKNYRYVNDWRAIFFLPLLQLTADIAVMTGSIAGLWRRKYGIF